MFLNTSASSPVFHVALPIAASRRLTPVGSIGRPLVGGGRHRIHVLADSNRMSPPLVSKQHRRSKTLDVSVVAAPGRRRSTRRRRTTMPPAAALSVAARTQWKLCLMMVEAFPHVG